MASCDPILEEDGDHELKVTFHPPLYLQRKIWVLDVMRREGIVDVVDIGCGEGQLLNALSQPAPWLPPPPPGIIPAGPDNEPSNAASPASPTTPNFNSASDPIPNLHPQRIAGLDIAERDLQFAIEAVAPPLPNSTSTYTCQPVRWEPLVASIWKGGLQVINEEFVNTECIVSSEVIEHLPPDVLPFFAPVLLGVYHPYKLLVTTPSYTFNARFTSPNAPPSVRKGYPDPTKRTERIFRHHDHKFEWTVYEFEEWCTEVANKWGYRVEPSDVGRAVEEDPWGRDAELGGASLVAEFTRLDIGDIGRKALEDEARRMVLDLGTDALTHERLSLQEHPPHPLARQPASFEDIGARVKAHLEESRDAIQSFEEVWYRDELAILCGGWTEVLAKAVESCEGLALKRDEAYKERPDREAWMIELIGGPSQPRMLWPTTEEVDRSVEYMSPDWIPVEDGYSDSSSSSSEGGGDEWGDSTGAEEGDISWGNYSEEDKDDHIASYSQRPPWMTPESQQVGGWGGGNDEYGWGDIPTVPQSDTSTAGWEGDESESVSSRSTNTL